MNTNIDAVLDFLEAEMLSDTSSTYYVLDFLEAEALDKSEIPLYDDYSEESFP